MRETDRLREMLDKRGIEHFDSDFGVTWDYYTDPHTADDSFDGPLIVTGLTAEQAIAATLDFGRCEEMRALIADMWSWMERAMYDGEQGKGEYLALYERKVRLEIES